MSINISNQSESADAAARGDFSRAARRVSSHACIDTVRRVRLHTLLWQRLPCHKSHSNALKEQQPPRRGLH